jgi:hypothetical protein
MQNAKIPTIGKIKDTSIRIMAGIKLFSICFELSVMASIKFKLPKIIVRFL